MDPSGTPTSFPGGKMRDPGNEAAGTLAALAGVQLGVDPLRTGSPKIPFRGVK